MADTIQVQVTANGPAFRSAVEYAKLAGGVYDPGTRIWTIRAEFEDEAKDYGLRRITSEVANLGEKRTKTEQPTATKKPKRLSWRQQAQR